MALLAFCSTLLLLIQFSVLLFILICGGGCEQFNSSLVVHVGSASSCTLMYGHPTSDLITNAITYFIVFAKTYA